MIQMVEQALRESSQALEALCKNPAVLETLAQAGRMLGDKLATGHRAYACGNGGSMCDAMHFAEELTGRFRENRRPLAAVAISDPSYLTCTSNDFGYEFVFSRFVEAFGQKDDFLLAISTSGKSPNVLRAAEVARAKGMHVIALTGHVQCPLAEFATFHIPTPSGTKYADRVQELHIKCIHILIELAEKAAGL